MKLIANFEIKLVAYGMFLKSLNVQSLMALYRVNFFLNENVEQ